MNKMHKCVIAIAGVSLMAATTWAATTANVSVGLVRGANSGAAGGDIVIAPTSVDFGMIDPNVNGMRVESATDVFVSYAVNKVGTGDGGADASAWKIWNYTSNPGNQTGLMNADGGTIPLKLILEPSFGLDWSQQVNWDNSSKWILDVTADDADKDFFALVSSSEFPAEQDIVTGSTTFHFLSDITEATPGVSYSTDVTLEIVYE